MERRIVSGILILLLAGMLSLTFDTRSEYEKSNSHNNEQVRVTTTPLVSSSMSAVVRFDPPTHTFITERGIDVGYRFNTTIELYDVAELFAWQVRVFFNNTILNATNAYYHPDEPIHSVNHATVSPAIVNDFNETHGYVQLGISAIYPDYVNVTADDYPKGVGICFAEFEVLTAPTNLNDFQCDLVLNNTRTYLLWKDGNTEIPCEKIDGWYCLDDAAAVPTEYATIQDAINALDSKIMNPYKNSVFVYDGEYYENVIVNKTTRLLGESADAVVVKGNGGTVFSVSGVDNVIIEGFTMTLGNVGVYISRSQHGLILSNNIIGNTHGIYSDASPNWVYCNSWVVCNNSIIANSGCGIYAYASGWLPCFVDAWTIESNDVIGNGYGIHAYGDIYGRCNGWTVCSNNITGNSNNGINAYGALGGFYGGYCDSWVLRHNSIYGNSGIGIHTAGQAGSWTIYGNNICENQHGIYLSSSNNILRENQMINNRYNFGVSDSYIQDVDASNRVNGKPIYYWIHKWEGQIPLDAGYIALVESANITARNFNLTDNAQGILLYRTANVTLESIYTGNNLHGIYLRESLNCTVLRNRSENNVYGVYLAESSNCNILGNNIEENRYGIFLIGSSSNNITHNNFIQNDQQVAMEGTVVNVWDNGYPSGGNYWSDHTGPDECRGICQNETGSDGIVDDPYVVNRDNADNYPLSALWSSPIHIIMPGNTTYRGTNITLTFTVDFSPNWIGYSLDDQANVTITGNMTLTGLSYGLHHITIYANNTSTNMFSSAQVHFTITFLTDLNYDRTVDMKDLAMACYAYGSVPGDPRWKVVADVNHDGIVDIEDIALVATDYGKTW